MLLWNHISAVMVSVLASSVVDSWIRYPIVSNERQYNWYLLLLNYARSIKEKKQDWLAMNQDNVSEWCDMSTRGLLFQWITTLKIIQLSVFVWYKADLIINWKLQVFVLAMI